MFCHYLDAHRAMMLLYLENGVKYSYKIVRVAMNHFEVQRG